MRVGPLSMFTRTNQERSFNLAAWHSPHSLTWRWLIHVRIVGAGTGERRWRFGFHKWHSMTGGLQWVMILPLMQVNFAQQRPIWYRDMWRRERDERDGLAGAPPPPREVHVPDDATLH